MISYLKRAAGRLLRLARASDRHRADRRSAVQSPFVPPCRRPAPIPPLPTSAVHVWDTPLVRPYLAAYEREEKARIQRLRRDILWCATYGVDLDTRDIHARLGAAS
ncbi:hypothetical protein ACH47Z_27885 [Streptomyces sp. NPDC020192]|uniref:hypothetical protein n=1 Tax=Streptomyces sp. NPDC020192 TaxID=3365066 RepID=UPI0037A6FDA4